MEEAGRVHQLAAAGRVHLGLEQLEHTLHHRRIVPGQTDHPIEVNVGLLQAGHDVRDLSVGRLVAHTGGVKELVHHLPPHLIKVPG